MAAMNQAEWLALAGLIKLMKDADGVVTLKEHRTVGKLASRMGSKLWEALALAERDLDSEAAIRRQAAKVRPQSQALVRGALEELALADGLAEPEQELLAWLDELWASA